MQQLEATEQDSAKNSNSKLINPKLSKQNPESATYTEEPNIANAQDNNSILQLQSRQNPAQKKEFELKKAQYSGKWRLNDIRKQSLTRKSETRRQTQ